MATPREIEYLLEKFDYKYLVESGFFKDIDESDHDAQIKRICEWMGMKNIFDYDKIMSKNTWEAVAPDLQTFSKN